MAMKNYDTNRDRTSDLPNCSTEPYNPCHCGLWSTSNKTKLTYDSGGGYIQNC